MMSALLMKLSPKQSDNVHDDNPELLEVEE